VQNHYSLCYREEEREMNKYCHETGVGLIAWAPLYRGHLARPLNSEKTERSDWSMNPKLQGGDVEIIKRVAELADKKEWKMSQVALAWIIQKGSVPIVGFNNLDRLDDGCEVRGKRLSDDEMERLEEPYISKPIYGHK
jgi:aryl-alcohol dehydrogenase-like predicted oxidoreductase